MVATASAISNFVSVRSMVRDCIEPKPLRDNRFVTPLITTLEDLKGYIGKEIGVSDWLLITQQRVQQFADATNDHQWIHLDAERAAEESPYGGTIAHGFLTLSLQSPFMRQTLVVQGLSMTINYGLNRVRFPAPVPVGARIRARFTLQAVKDLAGGVEAVYNTTLEIENAAKPCCVAEWIVRYYAA
jgi:acyl dehydratase